MNDKYVIFFLSKTKKVMQQYIGKRLKEEGITDIVPSYGNIFTVLYEHEGCLTMKDIAKKVGKDKSTITSLVKTLMKSGYIEKEVSEEDKRVSYIKLTEKGWSFKPIYDKISSEVYDLAYKNFNDDDKELFLSLLKQMYTNFK